MNRKTVIFLCTANRCRSLMGEYFLRSLLQERGLDKKVVVMSAGVMAEEYWSFYEKKVASFGHEAKYDHFYDKAPYPTTITCMERRGWDTSSYRSQILTKELVEAAALVIAMEKEQKDASLKQYPELSGRIATLRELSGEEGALLLEESYYQPEYNARDPHFVFYSEAYVEKSFQEIEECLRKGLPALLELIGIS